MEDDSIAFGLHTGTFQSLFDGVEETTSFSDSALGGVTVSDKGFFPDLGLPYDDISQKWSLLEQLQIDSTNRSPTPDHVENERYSPRPSSACDAFITEDTCILSPFSESGDSGVSSCHSPLYGDCHADGLDSSVWLQDQLMNENELPGEFGDLLDNIEVLSSSEEGAVNDADFQGEYQSILPQIVTKEAEDGTANDILIEDQATEQYNESIGNKSDELVETHQVPFIEHTEVPPVLVEESSATKAMQNPIQILPAPLNGAQKNQMVFILKAATVVPKPAQAVTDGLAVVEDRMEESLRSAPYPKKRPSKSKTPQQKEKKKHQNRSAASRYRNKKKDELNDLFEEARGLEETNKTLGDKVDSLTKEIDYLKGLMLDVIKAKLSRTKSQTS